ncbi:hypothetical protein RFI_24074 [Reticulomyxa filosa]|uniref:Uncharacterized protein n=1 Tax=Reticulomyxa filosa TaxID=46433 RepID=X6MIN3_RETFI|nr:hypothetical protein RFI_24074 [Reticulomyxa filosa]|eukprot:ETO13302.1 hypothetical protein RFI_24074 [Reticulomyxa filosa]
MTNNVLKHIPETADFSIRLYYNDTVPENYKVIIHILCVLCFDLIFLWQWMKYSPKILGYLCQVTNLHSTVQSEDLRLVRKVDTGYHSMNLQIVTGEDRFGNDHDSDNESTVQENTKHDRGANSGDENTTQNENYVENETITNKSFSHLQESSPKDFRALENRFSTIQSEAVEESSQEPLPPLPKEKNHNEEKHRLSAESGDDAKLSKISFEEFQDYVIKDHMCAMSRLTEELKLSRDNVREYLDKMVENGILYKSGNRWHFTPKDGLTKPVCDCNMIKSFVKLGKFFLKNCYLFYKHLNILNFFTQYHIRT